MEDLEKEKEQLSHAVETNAIIAKLLESHSQQNKRLWISNIVSWIIIVAMIFAIGYQGTHMQAAVSAAIAESQETFNKALATAFDTIAEMEVVSDTTTTTTTQTVEGDSAVINNVEGEQYNDSSRKNGGGD